MEFHSLPMLISIDLPGLAIFGSTPWSSSGVVRSAPTGGNVDIHGNWGLFHQGETTPNMYIYIYTYNMLIYERMHIYIWQICIYIYTRIHGHMRVYNVYIYIFMCTNWLDDTLNFWMIYWEKKHWKNAPTQLLKHTERNWSKHRRQKRGWSFG